MPAALILFSGMFLCGFLSVTLGKELCWDLANYHYYIPYAFLHQREAMDYWPNSFIHQYLNPALDYLTYFLINHTTPVSAEFILGALHGVNIVLLFAIARLLVNHFFIALLLALLGLYGPLVLPGIGSFQNDNLISVFVLGFVLLQIHQIKQKHFSYLILLCSGVLLGFAIGLKLTAGLFAIGALVSYLILPLSFQQRVRIIVILLAGFTVGMALSSGYWMYRLWIQFGNPFYPFLNHIFKAPGFAAVSWRDTRFLPKSAWEALFFPFYFSWDGRVADIPFRDFRFMGVYILFAALGAKHLLRRVVSPAREIQWLFWFFIFSFLVWEYYFSIGRYIVALEMLSPLVIYLLVKSLIPNHFLSGVTVYSIFYTLLITMQPEPMVRTPDYHTSFFNVRLPYIVQNHPSAVVLTAYPAYVMERDPRPQMYLIPFFPRAWRFFGIPFQQGHYFDDGTTTETLQKLIKGMNQPIYLLTSDLNMPALMRIAEIYFHLKPIGSCEKIFSDRQAITHQDTLLCPVG